MATSDKAFKYCSLMVLCLLIRCSGNDISRSFWTDEANRLLSADETKTWLLASRTENGAEVVDACWEDNKLIFVKNTTADSLYILGRNAGCTSGAAVDTIYKAKYTLKVSLEDAFQDSITLSEERHAEIGTFAVNELTSKQLKILFVSNGLQVEELYTH